MTSSVLSGDQSLKGSFYKVVILGDKNIGKTCLIKRVIENTFSDHEDATLGAQFHSKKFSAELD